MSAMWCLLAIWAVFFEVHALPDLCQPGNYRKLSDVRRSSGYRMLSGEPGLCDINLTPGWYRFTSVAGGMMPEHCLHRSQCGTLVPVWLNSTHPTVGDGVVSRTACANFGFGGRSTACCDHHIPIGVKNCGSFFLYYLQPTPSCPVAYCAGSTVPCPAGQWSSTGLPPCVDAYPIIHTYPTLTGPITNKHSFHFSCRVNYPQHDPDLRFEVQWMFDNGTGAGIPNMLLVEPNREATLPGTALAGNLDHLLRCRVRAWYANRSVLHKSPWRVSNESYYVGFRVDPGMINVTDATRESQVTITSTLPIVCDHSFTAACCISLNLDVDGPKNTVVVPHPCSYKLCSKDWNPATQTASKVVTVSARKNQIVDGSKRMFLSFEKLEAAGGGGYLNVFSNYTLPEVQVAVQQAAPLKCQWTGDPHITGFAGQRFHLFDAGDFTMYKNDHDNFEIQSRTYVCGKVACQCGLLIKELNDVIHINNCADMKHAPVVETTHPLREGTVIERSNDGMHIMVYLPSGREVKVDVGSFYHNVFLTLPASDQLQGRGRGICGTPDSRSDNEFMHANGTIEKDPCPRTHRCVPVDFEESWRLNTSKSLFHVLPPAVHSATESAHYCQCDTGVAGPPRVNCSVAAHVAHMQRCSPCKPVGNLPAFLANPSWSTTRRDVHDDHTGMDVPQPPHLARARLPDRWSLNFPTPSGITATQARDKCQAEIQRAQLFSHCSTKTQLLKDVADGCIMDVLFLDSFDMVDASLEAFTDGCQFDLIRDIKNYHLDADGNLVLGNHVTNVCPTQCLRHGRCVNGACVCAEGYTGSSCQLVAGVGPRLLKILSSSPCDAGKEECRKIYIEADGFENSDQFQCRIQQDMGNGSLSTSVVMEKAEFITSGRLACPLPDARLKTDGSVKTFAVAVTYDGSVFSDVLRVTVFDSLCQQCDDIGCSAKSDACLINRLCYRHGDVNPNDAVQTCNSSRATWKWSDPFPTITEVSLTGADTDNIYTCSFNGSTPAQDVAFEVTWQLNGQGLAGATTILPTDPPSATMHQSDLPSHTGTLTCLVRAFYFRESVQSDFVTSNPTAVQ